MSTKSDETPDISKKRKRESKDSTDLKKAKHKRKHKKHKKSTTNSESESTVDKNRKKKRSKEKRKKEKAISKQEEKEQDDCFDVPMSLMNPSKSMAPITKEEWEKKQSVVKRVFDDTSGRYRLIKGDGEIIEEIVSKDRHKEINQQATKGDGLYFQNQLSTSQNK